MLAASLRSVNFSFSKTDSRVVDVFHSVHDGTSNNDFIATALILDVQLIIEHEYYDDTVKH